MGKCGKMAMVCGEIKNKIHIKQALKKMIHASTGFAVHLRP